MSCSMDKYQSSGVSEADWRSCTEPGSWVPRSRARSWELSAGASMMRHISVRAAQRGTAQPSMPGPAQPLGPPMVPDYNHSLALEPCSGSGSMHQPDPFTDQSSQSSTQVERGAAHRNMVVGTGNSSSINCHGNLCCCCSTTPNFQTCGESFPLHTMYILIFSKWFWEKRCKLCEKNTVIINVIYYLFTLQPHCFAIVKQKEQIFSWYKLVRALIKSMKLE